MRNACKILVGKLAHVKS